MNYGAARTARALCAAVLLALPAGIMAAPLQARDDLGRVIHLAGPAGRIVSLSPHATEMLFAIGAGDRVVGRDSASDYPAAAQGLPALGQYGAYNVEAILALRPDLVVVWQGPQAGPAVRKLAELGLPVFASQPEQIGQIGSNLRALGVLSGRRQAGEQAAQAFERGWQALAQRYQHKRRLRVVPQVGDAPAMTVNGQQFTSALFRLCGSDNPYATAREPVPLLSSESLLARAPDAMVALAEPAQAERWQAPWRKLLPRTAMLQLDPVSAGRPGPRVLRAAEQLCVALDRLRRAD